MEKRRESTDNDEMNNPTEDLVDQAISRRLSRLAQYPVDTSRLDKTIRAQIPPVPAFQLRRWFRPMMAVAASLLVMGMIALVLFHSQRPWRHLRKWHSFTGTWSPGKFQPSRRIRLMTPTTLSPHSQPVLRACLNVRCPTTWSAA